MDRTDLTVLKRRTFSVVRDTFLSLTKDVFVLCQKLQLLMTNGFVIFILPVIDADNFGIFITLSGVNCGHFGYF